MDDTRRENSDKVSRKHNLVGTEDRNIDCPGLDPSTNEPSSQFQDQATPYHAARMAPLAEALSQVIKFHNGMTADPTTTPMKR